MELFDLFLMLRNMFLKVFGLYDRIVFQVNGYEVTLGGMIFVTFVVLFVVSIFWKGVKA